MEIHSYRSVFDLERRIYRIDRLRLNPAGVPIRGIVYFVAFLIVAFVLRAVPLLGTAVGVVPWYMRELALPAAAAGLLTVMRIDGRPFHRFAVSLICEQCSPRAVDGTGSRCRRREVWRPSAIVLLPDGSEAKMRRLLYRGPGVIVLYRPHRGVESRLLPWLSVPASNVSVTQIDGGRLSSPRAIALGARARLRVG
jgi:hypothetical protein